MSNKFSSIDAELETDQCMGIEMREPNDAESLASPVLTDI